MSTRPGIRVGIGFDFHPFATGRDLLLGGVLIPYDRGLQGHSDADALLHAVADALLGAAGLPDIGHYFPDSDERYKGFSSLLLLAETVVLVRHQGFEVGNIDVVVIAEVPRIKPHVDEMKTAIGRCLGLPSTAIGIKATTMEKKGTIGRQEGIAVQAVALLFRTEDRDDSH